MRCDRWVVSGLLAFLGRLLAAAVLALGAVLGASASMGCSESSCGWWEGLIPFVIYGCAAGAIAAFVLAVRAFLAARVID